MQRHDKRQLRIGWAEKAQYAEECVCRFCLSPAGAPLYGTVPIHGAKNSVLPILAAAVLCRSPCVLHNCPQIEDVDTALEILKCLGCRSERRGGSLFVDASGMDGCEIPVELAGKMRSSIVFLGPVLARRGKARLALPAAARWAQGPSTCI